MKNRISITNNDPAILPEVLEKELAKSLKVLEACAKYGFMHAVMYPSGVVAGTLTVAPIAPARKKKVFIHKHGELKAVYQPILNQCKPGEVVTISCGKYPQEAIRSAACSASNMMWGNGSYTSTLTKDKKSVEIYRH